MNKAKQLAENLNKRKDVFFESFSQRKNELSYYEQLSAGSYYQRNRLFFLGCVAFASFAQLASMISSYSFILSWISIKLTNEVLAIASCIAFLVLIEAIKYISVHKVFADAFNIESKAINYVAIMIALIVSAFSMFASVKGGGSLGIDTAKVVNTKSEFDNEIAQVREEIKGIKDRNTWKGNTYIAGKDKTLLLSKEAVLASLRGKKDNSLSKIEADNEQSQTAFQYGFMVIELLFFLFTYFQYNYKYRVAVELAAEKVNVTEEVTKSVTQVTNLNPIPSTSGNIAPQTKKIGFSFSNNPSDDSVTKFVTNEVQVLKEGNRICLHCNQVYTYKRHDQKYCTEKCRVEAWQLKTGKTLAKKGGKSNGK